MRTFFIILLAGVVGWFSPSAHGALVNGVAVIVNDKVITYQDIEIFVAPEMDLLERQYFTQPETLEKKKLTLRTDGLEQLVERQLILYEFKTAGYMLPESYLNDVVNERIKQRFGDRATATKTLKENGLTLESFRQRTREEIIVEALSQKNIASEFIISPHKVETYYAQHTNDFAVKDEVKLRRIILNKPPGRSAETVRKIAEEILAKLNEGVPFAEMASIYSEGSDRGKGGDTDWLDMVVKGYQKELRDAVAKLKPGQRTGIIDTGGAYIILLLEDRRPAHIKSLPEVRDQIERNLSVQEKTRLRTKWIDRLKKKSFVAYF